MQAVKTTKEYTVFKKRSGRHAVQKLDGTTWIRGDEKTKILLKEGLIKLTAPKKKEEAPAAEATPAAEAPQS